MTEFLQHNGLPIYVRGYAAVFDRPSHPLGRNDGRREIVRSGAFDRAIRNPSIYTKCVAHHLEGPGLGSIMAGNLRLWADDFGLAFEAGPLKATLENHQILSAIVTGQLRGCSWSATTADARNESINGEEFVVIREFATLDHVGPVEDGAYPDACVWCSHEQLQDLTPDLREVVERWQRNRAVAQERVGARRKPAIAASARSSAQAPDPVVSDWEAYGPPPAGLSMDAWMRFGQITGHAAREMQRAERLKAIRQGRST